MPFLQILTGGRADELFELNPAATLLVGSGPDAHIRLPDARVGASHCRVYPAQGKYWLQDLGASTTVINLRRVPNETTGLAARDIIILGQTFVRFIDERPEPEPDGAAPKGADPAELTKANERVRALEAQLRTLEGHAAGAQSQLVSDLRAQLVKAEESDQRNGSELEKARARVLTLEKEQDKLRARLTEVQSEARKALAAKAEEIKLSEEVILNFEATAAASERELAQRTGALEQAERQIASLQEELAQVTQRADERVASAGVEQRSRLSALEAALSASTASLAASRAALQALGIEPPAAPDRPDGVAPLELAAALDGASLSAEVRARLEQALVVHIDREALRRFTGPPFSWERPQRALEVAAELASLRARGERWLTEVRLETATA